jgi:hypothetical protein
MHVPHTESATLIVIYSVIYLEPNSKFLKKDNEAREARQSPRKFWV